MELRKQLKVKNCLERFQVTWDGGMNFTFDETAINKDDMILKNENKTVERIGSKNISVVFAKGCIKKGKVRWRIDINAFKGNSPNNFVFGVVERN